MFPSILKLKKSIKKHLTNVLINEKHSSQICIHFNFLVTKQLNFHRSHNAFVNCCKIDHHYIQSGNVDGINLDSTHPETNANSNSTQVKCEVIKKNHKVRANRDMEWCYSDRTAHSLAGTHSVKFSFSEVLIQ